MRIELIQEFEQVQLSRANHLAYQIADNLVSSVDQANEKLANRFMKRGEMLLMLEKKLNLSALKKIRKRFFKP